jgi:hypothetical protein
MTTPTGNITLGNVAAELGIGLPLTIGDGRCRALAGVPSGPITLGQLRGKSVGAAQPPAPVYPPRDQLLRQYCNGTTLVGAYTDGMGTEYQQAIEFNSPSCGYVPPTPAGTLLSTYCSGTTKMGTFADGGYGTYDAAITGNSPDCGYSPHPARGTFLYEYCGAVINYGGEGGGYGYPLYYAYADGNGGQYDVMQDGNSAKCYPSGGGFQGG